MVGAGKRPLRGGSRNVLGIVGTLINPGTEQPNLLSSQTLFAGGMTNVRIEPCYVGDQAAFRTVTRNQRRQARFPASQGTRTVVQT